MITAQSQKRSNTEDSQKESSLEKNAMVWRTSRPEKLLANKQQNQAAPEIGKLFQDAPPDSAAAHSVTCRRVSACPAAAAPRPGTPAHPPRCSCPQSNSSSRPARTPPAASATAAAAKPGNPSGRPGCKGREGKRESVTKE